MRGFVADFVHAVRLYTETPMSSFIAVAILAIGISCATSFLSLFSDLVLQSPTGFEESSRIVTIAQTNGSRNLRISFDLLRRIEQETASIEAIAGVAPTSVTLNAESSQQPVELVTRGFFGDLVPRLAIGRAFDDQDHQAGASPVAILSFDYWQQRFAGDPDVIGRTIEVTGRPRVLAFNPDGPQEPPSERTIEYLVVGVSASGVSGVLSPDSALWLPYEEAALNFLAAEGQVQAAPLLQGLARIASGASAQAAQVELNERFSEIGLEGGVPPGFRFQAHRGIVRDINVQRNAQRQVSLLLGGGVLVALVAAANVSLFLLSTAPGRRRELAIRLAVGAPYGRLRRQLLTEASVLVLSGVGAGTLLGVWATVLLRNLPLFTGTQWQEVSPFDWRVLLLVAILAAFVTLLVSMAPILGLRRTRHASDAGWSAARASIAQRVAGNLQLAVVGGLMGAALAFGWYLLTLQVRELGYSEKDVHVISIRPSGMASNNIDYDGILIQRERVRSSILGLPGVQGVSFGSSVPGRVRPLFSLIPPSRSGEEPAEVAIVSADREYPSLLGIDFMHGQPLESGSINSILVNETLAQEFWGRTDVVGERLILPQFGSDGARIAGVLQDVSYEHPASPVRPTVFLSATVISPFDSILVKSTASSAAVQGMLQRLRADKTLEVDIENIDSLADIRRELLAADRARAFLTASSAIIALAIAAFGTYGIQRYIVATGRREYAIRAALGAGPKRLGRLVIGRGLAMSLPGIALGSLLSFNVVAWLLGDYVSTAVSPIGVAAGVAVGSVLLVLAASLAPAIEARTFKPGLYLKSE